MHTVCFSEKYNRNVTNLLYKLALFSLHTIPFLIYIINSTITHQKKSTEKKAPKKCAREGIYICKQEAGAHTKVANFCYVLSNKATYNQ